MSGVDAIEYLIVGARAVQVGTANFIDPGAAARIAREMKDFCERQGIANIADLVGTMKKD
jgi:dihydroorotate dehydrogenase (NAD+) catalytic subunit